jgi:hypothetical protein
VIHYISHIVHRQVPKKIIMILLFRVIKFKTKTSYLTEKFDSIRTVFSFEFIKLYSYIIILLNLLLKTKTGFKQIPNIVCVQN